MAALSAYSKYQTWLGASGPVGAHFRAPTRTVANRAWRSTLRCWETAGWLIPNSAEMAATISPPSAHRRIRSFSAGAAPPARR
jgi:hypothetical protein